MQDKKGFLYIPAPKKHGFSALLDHKGTQALLAWPRVTVEPASASHLCVSKDDAEKPCPILYGPHQYDAHSQHFFSPSCEGGESLMKKVFEITISPIAYQSSIARLHKSDRCTSRRQPIFASAKMSGKALPNLIWPLPIRRALTTLLFAKLRGWRVIKVKFCIFQVSSRPFSSFWSV
jgi:hypothetical protein